MPALHFRRLISAVSGPFQRPAAATTHPALVPLAACLLLITLAIPPAFSQPPDAAAATSSASAAADWLPSSPPSSPPRPHGSLTPPAQSAQPVQIGAGIEPVSITALLGKLALTAGLLYAGLWGWARWSRRGSASAGGGRGGLISVRERVSLGPAGHLYVVAFGSRNLLISAVGDRVTLLTDKAASEMEQIDTAALPAQSQDVASVADLPTAPPAWTSAAAPASDRAHSLLREDSRRAADWERKRDALVHALQESIES